MAIKFVNKNENEKYIILSDSLSSLISIKNKFNPSDIAIQIQNRLEEAKRKNNIIILIWIPGHIGIDGNEKADRQAKLATRSNDAQHINISQYTDVRKQIKQNTISLWQNIWYTQTNKLNQIKQTVKRWKRNTNISITEEKKLNRARIGHTNMTHGYLMAKDDPPICQFVFLRLITFEKPTDTMSVDPEKLAAAVFLKEPIWNPRHAGHKNRTIIQQCWSDLSKEMIIDAETLKAKWKNMRDYYRAELRKHPFGKSGAGAEDVRNSSWPLFKCLSYLRNTMQTRTRFTNIKSNFNSSEEADIESN
ncbi:hypothetical protein QTP88_028812 [Uroleucon formosanum]